MTRFDPHVARSLLRHELQLLCAGVAHAELGRRLGVSRAAFSQMLAGRNLPSLPALEVLTDHFDQRDRLPYLRELLRDARAYRRRWADPTGRGLAEGLRLTAARITAFDRCTVNPALRTSAYSAALGYEPPTVGHAAVTWFVEEPVLLRLVEHAETMSTQIDRLIVGHRAVRGLPPGSSEWVGDGWDGMAEPRLTRHAPANPLVIDTFDVTSAVTSLSTL